MREGTSKDWQEIKKPRILTRVLLGLVLLQTGCDAKAKVPANSKASNLTTPEQVDEPEEEKLSPQQKLQSMKFLLEAYEYKVLSEPLKQGDTDNDINQRYKTLKSTIETEEKWLEDAVDKGDLTTGEISKLREGTNKAYEERVGEIRHERTLNKAVDRLSTSDCISNETAETLKKLDQKKRSKNLIPLMDKETECY